MRNESITTVTLDLDDTLWPTWPVLIAAREKTQKYHEKVYPSFALEFPLEGVFQDVFTKTMKNNPHLSHNFTMLRKIALHECAVILNLDNPEQVVKNSFDVFISARNEVDDYIFPETVNILKKCKFIDYSKIHMKFYLKFIIRTNF